MSKSAKRCRSRTSSLRQCHREQRTTLFPLRCGLQSRPHSRSTCLGSPTNNPKRPSAQPPFPQPSRVPGRVHQAAERPKGFRPGSSSKSLPRQKSPLLQLFERLSPSCHRPTANQTGELPTVIVHVEPLCALSTPPTAQTERVPMGTERQSLPPSYQARVGSAMQ